MRLRDVHSTAVAEPVTERKWRTFADVVAFTLGTNVWISIVILPAIFIGALKTGKQVSAAALPFGVLLLGLARRGAIVAPLAPGALVEAGDEGVTLEVDGSRVLLAYRQIQKARLVPTL